MTCYIDVGDQFQIDIISIYGPRYNRLETKFYLVNFQVFPLDDILRQLQAMLGLRKHQQAVLQI